MDTIVEIHFIDYSDNEIVRNESDLKKVLDIVKYDPDCVCLEIVKQGDFKFDNPYTGRKIKSAFKKIEKLHDKLIEAFNRVQNAEKNLSQSYSRANRKALERAEAEYDKKNDALDKYVVARGTQHVLENGEIDFCGVGMKDFE